MIFPAAAPVLGDSDCNKTVRFAIEKVTVYLSTRLLDNGVAFMRPALDTNRLTHIYNRSARWYDVQHGCLTAWTDQKGRRMVVDQEERPFKLHALGLAQFRAGDYQQARHTLETSMNMLWGIGQNQAALALVCSALKQQATAQHRSG